jgi:NADH dehydrogenase [ubiquinone] 1 alpha subcomplex assembly factor 3
MLCHSTSSCFRSLTPFSRLITRKSPTLLISNRQLPFHRNIHVTLPKSVDKPTSFTNILADDTPPPIQISSVNYEGIHLEDGLILDSPALFLDGNVFLWDVPQSGAAWQGWTEEHFEALKVVVPKPGPLYIIS